MNNIKINRALITDNVYTVTTGTNKKKERATVNRALVPTVYN